MSNPYEISKFARWRKVKNSARTIIVLTLVLGLIYPAIADGFDSIYPYLNGLTIGLVGGLLVTGIEFYVFYKPNKKYNFITLVVSKVVIYTTVLLMLVLSVIMVSRGFQDGIYSPGEMLINPSFQHFLYHEDLQVIMFYTLLFAFLIIFVKEISKKLGREVLISFLTGKYYKPRKEQRIFMFIDLNDSTAIGEQLDNLEYHSFVNEFFKDITESIIFTEGEIYQYVGDEIIVSWPINRGIKNGNCIYTYFYAKQSIERNKVKFLNRYSTVPRFKVAVHCGNVIRGEVGDVKSDIVFNGDVMNTTSRIEKLCGSMNEPLLISNELIKKLPVYIQELFEAKGGFKVKGKEEELSIFGLKDKDQTFIRSKDVK